MRCPKCKNKHTKDTYVCPNCGTVLHNNGKKEIYVTDEILSVLGVKSKKKQEHLTVDSVEGYEVIFRTTSEIEANLIKNILEESIEKNKHKQKNYGYCRSSVGDRIVKRQW